MENNITQECIEFPDWDGGDPALGSDEVCEPRRKHADKPLEDIRDSRDQTIGGEVESRHSQKFQSSFFIIKGFKKYLKTLA